MNRNLKSLYLAGNPVASHAGYRPALTCMLPHLRNVDNRTLPKSPMSVSVGFRSTSATSNASIITNPSNLVQFQHNASLKRGTI